MREFALEHLRDQTYLLSDSDTIESIIDYDLMPKFEEIKRSVSLDDSNKIYRLNLRGLKRSQGNHHLVKDHFVMTK